jgi:hypothetical protein
VEEGDARRFAVGQAREPRHRVSRLIWSLSVMRYWGSGFGLGTARVQ